MGSRSCHVRDSLAANHSQPKPLQSSALINRDLHLLKPRRQLQHRGRRLLQGQALRANLLDPSLEIGKNLRQDHRPRVNRPRLNRQRSQVENPHLSRKMTPTRITPSMQSLATELSTASSSTASSGTQVRLVSNHPTTVEDASTSSTNTAKPRDLGRQISSDYTVPHQTQKSIAPIGSP